MSLCCAAILAAGTARDMWAALCATLCGEQGYAGHRPGLFLTWCGPHPNPSNPPRRHRPVAAAAARAPLLFAAIGRLSAAGYAPLQTRALDAWFHALLHDHDHAEWSEPATPANHMLTACIAGTVMCHAAPRHATPRHTRDPGQVSGQKSQVR
jgi:hypothetical protein